MICTSPTVRHINVVSRPVRVARRKMSFSRTSLCIFLDKASLNEFRTYRRSFTERRLRLPLYMQLNSPAHITSNSFQENSKLEKKRPCQNTVAMAKSMQFFNQLLGSLSTRVFETRTATGSELFSLLTCLHTTPFALPSIFSPLEMLGIKIWETPLS